MSENKQPHKTLTDKNNGLSSAQEVLYAKDYKRADKATEKEENNDKK
ncbi:YfhE family protein [Sporosarcina ureae]|nr:YfhE family protein [Sporosarcina ureae]